MAGLGETLVTTAMIAQVPPERFVASMRGTRVPDNQLGDNSDGFTVAGLSCDRQSRISRSLAIGSQDGGVAHGLPSVPMTARTPASSPPAGLFISCADHPKGVAAPLAWRITLLKACLASVSAAAHGSRDMNYGAAEPWACDPVVDAHELERLAAHHDLIVRYGRPLHRAGGHVLEEKQHGHVEHLAETPQHPGGDAAHAQLVFLHLLEG